MARRCVLALLLCWSVALVSPQRAVDGDTFDAVIEIWPKLVATERVRIVGLQTPERGRLGYKEAADFLGAWLQAGDVTITTCQRDAFGRILGVVTRGSGGEDVATVMKNAGLGKEWKR